ncbi:Paired domain-containing protein [Caenorhabditis elegans]|uniref:Paired domain-containing protein n=1 Tax=Caenorhabditis elegans TaxID=6239 RepID=Q17876_CAEEL|nr:Paired domain-containing protein [Caenorhabditis elegans]CAA90976.2 Paired domain-containing protein [Caenorhabditis elegans]|eukprot:NP_001255346.1 N-terminal PAX (PAI domain only) protein [Caenorhabditis elegans]
MMSPSIFPPINFLFQNSALLSSFAAQKALSNGHPSGSSLAALEKLSKAFRRPDLHIEKLASSCIDKQKDLKMTNVVPSRNRYGRPYISGRPLLTCDRQKIVECYKKGMKKIHIAKQLGITHSCVSKVLRRYAETGEIVAKACRTASCSCPGSAEEHDARYCKHLQDNTIRLFFSIENLLRNESTSSRIIYFSKPPSYSTLEI